MVVALRLDFDASFFLGTGFAKARSSSRMMAFLSSDVALVVLCGTASVNSAAGDSIVAGTSTTGEDLEN
jgi:hypothetical protein